MGCKCGSQIILCNLPVRFDTYRGCSHGCRYCFAQKKNDISHIERDESVDGLRSFIEGKRGNETEWCDWNIPIHWGGMSDPFQPVEKQIRASYECLKLLAETKYPFVVSTKGRLIADPEYLDLLAQCNCVLQISMVCSKYDRLERGTPSYEERLVILKTVSARVQRTIVRIQPYMPEVFHDVIMKYNNKVSAATIARTAALLLALANQILSAFGKSPLPIESSTVEQLVTTGITTVTALINWWYNNSFTQAAIEGDKTYENVKNQIH